MDNMNLDEMLSVLVEVAHEKVNVVQEIEFPAFCNQRISENVSESNCVPVRCLGEVSDACEPERRFDPFSFTVPLSRGTN